MNRIPFALALMLSGSLAATAPVLAQQQVVIPAKGAMLRWAHDPTIPQPMAPRGHASTDPEVLEPSDEVACADSEFRSTSSSGHPGSALVSRHKYCQQYDSSPTTISVDLMRRTQTSDWEFYRPGIAAVQFNTVEVGTLGIRTRVHAYGPSARLGKTHKIDVAATSFSFAPDFPIHLRAGIFVTLQPDGGASLPQNSGVQDFAFSVGTINPITLSAASPAGSTGAFDVNFSWTYVGADPLGNLVQFTAYVPRYAYTVNNTPRQGTPDPFYITAFSSASDLFPQRFRCDKGVASGEAATAEGCIFEQAAPILSLSATGDAAEEALHIYQAQTSTDAYKTEKSPGVFLAVPGTRVVADETGGAEFAGLIRGTDADIDANRNAACTAANSLIKIRPYSGSSSCPSLASPDCSCDEYPYAATKNGAAYNPSGTSVRYINATQNSRGEGLMQGFFKADRVIPGEKFWVRVTDIH